jgi:hypothetical protein
LQAYLLMTRVLRYLKNPLPPLYRVSINTHIHSISCIMI